MTGGRAYLYDPTGRHTAALDERSVAARPARHRPRRSSATARPASSSSSRSSRRTARPARARRPPARRGRPRGPLLARRADPGAVARGRATGRRRPTRRRGPIGHRRAVARGRIATRPQPHRPRTGADARAPVGYLRTNMGQRHPRVIVRRPANPRPSPEGAADDPPVRLRDPAAPPPSATAATRRSRAPRAAAA